MDLNDMEYRLTKDALLEDLYIAHQCARKHKASKSYVKDFEENLQENLQQLCDELWDKTYEALPSNCFIINYPKKREVFAAQYRDRIVHHLYFNYTHGLFERTFIEDSYSCIKGRGTSYGVERLAKHIRQESLNYKVPCYVLNLDIRGYFIHINRKRLLDVATESLRKMSCHKVSAHGTKRWREVIDVDFVLWLTEKIILLDPTENCIKICPELEWEGLDRNKSLFYTEPDCGLPIGNLTSQLFSNVYLNVLDQYIKRVLKCRHYCRYVDDGRIISTDRQWLLSLVTPIETFLKENLQLELHRGKLTIQEAWRGSEFLGIYIKPFRNYISNNALRRMNTNLAHLDYRNHERVWRTTCSYLGTLKHTSSYNIRRDMFMRKRFLEIAPLDAALTKMNKLYCTI